MLPSVASSDPRVFFQVSAALIPALVFGSLRLRPPKQWLPQSQRWHVCAFAVAGGGLVVFYAEVAAIQVGLTGNPDRQQTWLVAGVVVILTALTIGSLVWPWVRPIVPAQRTRRVRAVLGVYAVCLVATVVLSVAGLHTAVTDSQSLVDLDTSLRAEELNASTYSATEADKALAAIQADAAIRARAGLLSKAKARRITLCIAEERLRLAFNEELFRVTGEAVRVPRVARSIVLIPLAAVGHAKSCGRWETLP